MANPTDVWTIKAALDWTVGYLERKGDESPRLSAEWLLAEATAMRRIDLYVNFDRPLSMEERGVLRDYVARRGAGEPLQYITGEVAFRHIAVKVRPGVLIPRPETEVLVSEALSLLPSRARRCALDSLSADEQAFLLRSHDASADGDAGSPIGDSACGGDVSSQAIRGEFAHAAFGLRDGSQDGLLAADLCTGSGCIACSLAYEHPSVRVHATDISSEAVALARENVCALGLDGRVDVFECDLAKDLIRDFAGSFDLVVSNPPYIPDDVMEHLPAEVSDHEPRLALAGGADGLDVYRRILDQALLLLKPGGALAVELHEGSLDAAAEFAAQAGYGDIRTVSDLAGRPRVLTARVPRTDPSAV